MDSDRTPLGKWKNVLHGGARAAPLRQSVEQPCEYPYVTADEIKKALKVKSAMSTLLDQMQ
jgi:hypothetical protein